MTEVVLPNDANVHGTILGGKVMHLIDLAGAISAYRHCRKPVVTASVDSLCFLHPVKVGDLILLEAFLTRTFKTSMEVEVRVFSENPLTGTRIKTSSAFLTFVAVDEKGRPAEVPRLILRGHGTLGTSRTTTENSVQIRLFQCFPWPRLRRRRQRLAEAQAAKAKEV